MRRVFTLIAVLIILVFPLSALKSSFDLGINLSYNNADEVVEESGYSGAFDLERIAIGLEMRGHISNFPPTVAGDITILDTQTMLFSGIFGAGISVDLFKYLKFGVTTGPKVSYLYKDEVKSVSNDGEVGEPDNFFDALYTGYFHHRIMLDILAGPVMSIGVAYTLPTTFSLAAGNWEDLIPRRDDFTEGQIAVCIQMKVF
ncbi:MAG: hypothetical protein J5599_07190 [Spirochaetales bacterium]|nr:hypothetical protein [Spirochaetales bacterium]